MALQDHGQGVAGEALSGVVHGGDAVFEVAMTGLGFERDVGFEGDADLAPVVKRGAFCGLFAPFDEVGADAPAVGPGRRLPLERQLVGVLFDRPEFPGLAGPGDGAGRGLGRPPDQIELFRVRGGIGLGPFELELEKGAEP